MRKALKFMVAGSVSFLLLVVGFLAYIGWELRPQPPNSALPFILRDLYGDVDQARQRFRQRVHQGFPSGTDAAYLRAKLEREGFSFRSQGALEWTRRNEGQSEWAFFEQRGFPCVRYWTISWHRNSDGKAKNIEGAYSLGCL